MTMANVLRPWRAPERYPVLEDYEGWLASSPVRGGRRLKGTSSDTEPLPKVSVVTAVLNARSALATTLQSVQSQEGVALEHIIVDGGSTDGTVELLEQQGDRIEAWVSEPDRGIYDAINKGIALSRGTFINVIHAGDTYCHARVLADALSVCQDSSADVVYGDYLWLQPDWDVCLHIKVALDLSREPPCHPAMLIARRSHERLGLYRLDLSLAADHELALRFWLGGARFVHFAHPMAVYLAGGVSDQQALRIWGEASVMLLQHLGPRALARYPLLQWYHLAARGLAYVGGLCLGRTRRNRLFGVYFLTRERLTGGVRTVVPPPRIVAGH